MIEGYKRYHYHADAYALSGELTRPVAHVIEAQASTSLPSTGGIGHSRVENFRFHDIVSFTAGYSHVSGSVKVEGNKRTHNTHATAVVERLNILDVVTADRIVVRLSSSYVFDIDGNRGEPERESRIVIVGTKFENLRVAGCPIEVELHHELALQLPTFAKVRSAYRDNAVFQALAKQPVQEPGPDGVVHCSLVKHIWLANRGALLHDLAGPEEPKDEDGKPLRRKHCHGVERRGNMLKVEEFGTIHLAEIVFEHGRKTVEMLRIDLGSPNGGSFSGPGGSTNGRPPTP